MNSFFHLKSSLFLSNCLRSNWSTKPGHRRQLIDMIGRNVVPLAHSVTRPASVVFMLFLSLGQVAGSDPRVANFIEMISWSTSITAMTRKINILETYRLFVKNKKRIASKHFLRSELWFACHESWVHIVLLKTNLRAWDLLLFSESLRTCSLFATFHAYFVFPLYRKTDLDSIFKGFIDMFRLEMLSDFDLSELQLGCEGMYCSWLKQTNQMIWFRFPVVFLWKWYRFIFRHFKLQCLDNVLIALNLFDCAKMWRLRQNMHRNITGKIDGSQFEGAPITRISRGVGDSWELSCGIRWHQVRWKSRVAASNFLETWSWHITLDS